jgi:carboxypeptidase family protein/TonB-dependent receptor-like protein
MTRRSPLVCRLLAIAGSILTAAPVGAQSITGAAIQGRVAAADGTLLDEATVLATNTSNGERWSATTTSGGRWQLEHLSSGGPYRVEIRAIGFAPARREGLWLSVGQRLALDVALQPGIATLEPITVHAVDDPLINPGRTGPSRTISESTLARLPISNRNLLDVARLSPLATGAGSIAGQNDRLTAVQIDGSSGGDLLGGLRTPGQFFGMRALSVEAVKEVQVLGAPFDVRFGSFAAGLINVVTRSGTNDFEGAVAGYVTGDGLQGKDEFGGRGEDFTFADVSVVAGGPVRRDRAAWFVEGGRQHASFPLATPVIRSDTAGSGFRRASVIRLQQIAREVYGLDAGGTDPVPLDVPAWNLFAKLTVQLGINSRVDLSHQFARSDASTLASNCRVPGEVFCLGSSAFRLPTRIHVSRLAWATSLGPRISNDLLVTRSWFRQDCRTAAFPLVFVRADAGNLGVGGNSLCEGDMHGEQILEATDDVALTLGAHRLTVGAHGELIRLPTHENLRFGFGAQWHFASLDAFAAGQPDGYDGILQNPVRSGSALSDLETSLVSPYLQDQWSVTPRLLLTVGVRADVPFMSSRPARNAALSTAFGIDNSRTPSGHLLWSPRLGASYDVAGNGSTFLRGGVGLFAGRPAYRWFNEVYTHTGLEAIEVHCTGGHVPAFVTDPIRQPVGCRSDAGASPVAGPVSLFDAEFRFPRSLKMAIGVDHRLPWGLVGTVDLLYTRGVDQLDLQELNLQGPVGAASGEAGRPLYGTFDGDTMPVPARRAEDFGRVTRVGNAHGDRSVSVTLQVQKRFPGGQELSASYTHTAARDLLSATEDGLDANLDVVAVDGTLERRRRAPSAWSIPHRVLVLATTDLPLRFRMTLVYEGSSGGPFTWMVEGDANADGYANDPVYVPAHPGSHGDIRLVVEDAEGHLLPAASSEYARLAQVVREQSCLREQRGRLLRRNSCRNPWSSRTDARFSRLLGAGHGRTLEVTLDVFNLLHVLDADWGVTRGVDDVFLLRFRGYDPVAGRGVYQYLRRVTRAPDIGGSRWRMQLGGRLTL